MPKSREQAAIPLSSGSDLDALFAALRARGIRVGVEEELRARHVLAHAAAAGAADWELLIACIVVKSAAQERDFADVLSTWAQRGPRSTERSRQNGDASTIGQGADAPLAGGAVSVSRRRFSRAAWGIAVGAVLFGAVVVEAALWRTPSIADKHGGRDVEPEQSGATDAGPDAESESPSDAACPSTDGSSWRAAEHLMSDGGPPRAAPARPSRRAWPVKPAAAPVFRAVTAPWPERYETWVANLEPLHASPDIQPLRMASRSWWSACWYAGLAAWAFATAFGIVLVHRKRAWLPGAATAPSRPGLLWVAPAPPVSARGRAARLLDPADREALVWGIGRFVSEVRTCHLDVAASVAATAASAGLPALRFLRARHDFEVWLWIDQSVGAVRAGAERSLERIADEVTCALAESGLTAERAFFYGIPDELWTADGRRFAPLEVDERRNAALVAVLTDGRILADRMSNESQRSRVKVLLRMLSCFPQLAFVDFGGGHHGLRALVAPHDIPVIAPQNLAAFLGGSVSPSAARSKSTAVASPHDVELSGDDLAWAACLALAPCPIEEDVAFALREAMGLAASPWILDTLRARVQSHGGWLDWEQDERIRRAPIGSRGGTARRRSDRVAYLQWLQHVSTKDGGVESGSLLERALAFWKKQLDDEERRRSERDALEPWRETPAAQRLMFDRAWLDLWTAPTAKGDPFKAIETLYSLHGDDRTAGPLRPLVRERLRKMRTTDCPHVDEAIAVPWSLNDRTDRERLMLQQMEFGADHCGVMEPVSLRLPRRLRAIVACVVALGVLEGALSVMSAWGRSASIALDPGSLPPGAWARATLLDRGSALLDVGHPRCWQSPQVVRTGTRVRWERATRPCREKLDGVGEVWRCGTLTDPVRSPGSPDRPTEAVLVDASTDDPDAQDFAAGLLDSGSFDRVIWTTSQPVHGASTGDSVATSRSVLWASPGGSVATSRSAPWASAANRWVGPGRVELRVDARLHESNASRVASAHATGAPRITAESWVYLLGALGFEGIRSASQAWPEAQLEGEGAADVRVRGSGGGGLDMVWVRGGEFVMGSEQTDPEAYENEKPAHRVRVTGFWIGKREVSNREYRAFDPGKEGVDHLPVLQVSWNEAKAFCEGRRLRLPTEAEWEFAARGAASWKYPWGNDPPDENRAVFHPVSSFGMASVESYYEGAGPFGTLHQVGNAWEWVADCYDMQAYEKHTAHGAIVVNPFHDCPLGSSRVLRGGSFLNIARNIRSAVRLGDNPGTRDWLSGFRCARGPK